MTKEKKEEIEVQLEDTIIHCARKATQGSAIDAMQFSQAAVNTMNALVILIDVSDRIKGV